MSITTFTILWMFVYITLVDSRDIHLKKRLIRTFPDKRARTISSSKIISGSGRRGLVILQLIPNPTAQQLLIISEELDLFTPPSEHHGLGHYLDGGAYLVYGYIDYILSRALELEVITFAEEYRPDDRTEIIFDSDQERRSSDLSDTARLHDSTIFLDAAFYVPVSENFTFQDWRFNNTRYWPLPPLVVRIEVRHSHHEILEYLKNDNRIFWISLSTSKQGLKNYGGRQILFEGSSHGSSEYLWNKGLTGSGQIIGIVDTGVDLKNCYFHDTSHPTIPFNTKITNHRKIAYYRDLTYIGRSDSPSGHGTHCAGSIAGSVIQSNSPPMIKRYQGVAKDAKLYIAGGRLSDIANSGIYVPQPHGSDLFQSMYDQGVYIASNSWGCDLSILGIEMRKEGSEFVAYWSSSITSRNVCKNTKFKPIPRTKATDQQCRLCHGFSESSGMGCANLCNRYSIWEYELDQWLRLNKYFTAVFAAGNDGHVSEKYGITTSPSTAKNVLSVGASRTTNENIQQATDFVDMKGLSECCSSSSKSEKLQCCPNYLKSFFRSQKNQYNEECLAIFSSRGPAIGMTQPDVIAPGEFVVSANSVGSSYAHPYCGTGRPGSSGGGGSSALLSLQGTSMATPLISGLLGLIRQWFVDGNCETINNPTSYTMKAMLIHSTRSLTGKYIRGGYFYGLPKSYPTNEQGYGVPVVKNLLFGIDESPNYQLNIEEKRIEHGDEHLYCFTKTRDDDHDEEFRVTISWHDLPTSPTVSHTMSSTLVQDLDLLACRGDGKCWAGNQNIERDSSNVVEQVRCGTGILRKGDSFAFRVEARSIQGELEYSLVYSGYGYEKVENCDMVRWENAVFPAWGNNTVKNKKICFVIIVICWMLLFL